MPDGFRHIFLRDNQKQEPFTTPKSSRSKKNIPARNRKQHSDLLKRQWEAIWAKAKERDDAATAASKTTKDGVYVEFEGAPGSELMTMSLENRKAGVRLLSVYTVRSDEEAMNDIIRATVFVPHGRHDYFLKKVGKYATEDTKFGKPKNEALIRSVENIRLALVESFWRDPLDLLPANDTAVWCEIWLRDVKDNAEATFRLFCEEQSIHVQSWSLQFPERVVLLARATQEQLGTILEGSPYIAEFRLAKESAQFFMEQEPKEQTEWVDDLLKRLKTVPDPSVAICVLDTGANNGHALLSPLLANEDCHSVDPTWGTDDHDTHGHGTLVCGLAGMAIS